MRVLPRSAAAEFSAGLTGLEGCYLRRCDWLAMVTGAAVTELYMCFECRPVPVFGATEGLDCCWAIRCKWPVSAEMQGCNLSCM